MHLPGMGREGDVIRHNKRFRSDHSTWSFSGAPLDQELCSIADRGFVLAGDACRLEAFSSKNSHVKTSDFPDLTGYECFLNSVHVDDYVRENVVEQGFLFIERVFLGWQKLLGSRTLNALASIEAPGSMVVKFHLLRDGESWAADPLDDYLEEAVLVVDSREASIVAALRNRLKG